MMAAIIALLIGFKLKPLTKHLAIQKNQSAMNHLLQTVSKKDYRIGFTATALLSIGGFMMMPFGAAFAINNLHITQKQLPIIFIVSGLSTLIIMPLIGKLSDRIDKYKIFVAASAAMIIMVLIYTNLGVTPLWGVVGFNVLLMSGIMSRMIPSTALITGIPAMNDRGAFMSINASLQQIAGGIAAAFAGMIVVQKDKFSPLQHYNTLGYIIICISMLSVFMMGRVSQIVQKKAMLKKSVQEVPVPV